MYDDKKSTAKAQLKQLGVDVLVKDMASVVSFPDTNYPHNEFASSVFHKKVLMNDGSAHEYDEVYADKDGNPSPYSAKAVFTNYNFKQGGTK